ncbi:MAG: hypothetical protein QF722_04605, partial [Candidatus Thalassarchaeaceae archaeon]|nr:hypothetical protein [Candidatus Thalassarchaeaceae archaeon]
MRSRVPAVLLMAFLLLGTPLSGCFGSEDATPPTGKDLGINGALTAGDWTEVTLLARADLSVYIPYFVIDPGSERAQNGTVLDLKSGSSTSVEWLL